jgi:phosphatidylglycerol:prolipoprotein diacylglycerol transferase
MALGRWGNYFNQELFGWPTNLAWGIPISPEHRPAELLNFTYFHPTFLYESLWNFLIFGSLFLWHKLRLVKNKIPGQIRGLGNISLAYFILYSIGRFVNEFLRIDYSPYVLGLRWAQIISLAIIFICLVIMVYKIYIKFFTQPKTEAPG